MREGLIGENGVRAGKTSFPHSVRLAMIRRHLEVEEILFSFSTQAVSVKPHGSYGYLSRVTPIQPTAK
jgi:hypothetical protein